MTRRERSDEELKAAVKSRGFQPARADVDALFERLASPDEELAEAAERALARLGDLAAKAAMARLGVTGEGRARAPQRGRLVRLVGRVAKESASAELTQFLIDELGDAEDKTRRNAIIALGKLRGAAVEEALRAAWAREQSLPHRRSLAAALGKIGGAQELALLSAVETEDPELRRIVDEALLKVGRTIGRAQPGGIDARRSAPSRLEVHLHCREGLEELVCDELGKRSEPRVAGHGLVAAVLDGPLERLYRSRIMLRFGFPLPVAKGVSVEDAVVGALVSDRALAILRAFTDGKPRYRLEWSSGGHRRGLTFRVARAIAERRPELVNDPTASLWEAVVTESERGVTVELWPRGLEDPRFSYRQEHVPASSHPTLAAALAWVAGARPEDVVWDPFVGAGSELVERARLGPYLSLHGSDLDERAVELARRNLDAAGTERVTLARADARTHEPDPRPTLILTNPPMGRRVLNKELTGGLLDAFIAHAARVLAPGGRLVWISPRAAATVERALKEGLRCTFRQRVDMSGFWAELQVLERAGGRQPSAVR